MNCIKKLSPDTRYHRICLNAKPENQYANVKHKLAQGDLLFVTDRLREESLLMDETILDDLRFYGFGTHIKEILAGSGLFLESSAPGIMNYLQALIKEPDEYAKFIISKVPDLIPFLEDEVKAKFGLWKQLVKEKKWSVLRRHKKYMLLEKAGKENKDARRELIIAEEYFRIFRHPGWEEDLVYACDENNRRILTYHELISHGFYQLALEQYAWLGHIFPEIGKDILESLLQTAGVDFLFEQKNQDINCFLLEKGYEQKFVCYRNWAFLAEKRLYDLIDWEDFATDFESQEKTLTTSALDKDFVWVSAFKAGNADFLLKHSQYRFYFKLKWKQLWK